MRTETIKALREFYIPERVELVDPDFLEFEEEMSSEEDLGIILTRCYDLFQEGPGHPVRFWENPHNSIILFLTSLTDQFNLRKGRSDTIDGSPPDIDIDFGALSRPKVFDWIINHYGKENTARIGTFGEFKPRGMADDWHRIHEKPIPYVAKIKDFIPRDHAGKAAKLKDVVEAHPEFPDEYPEFYNAAKKLEGMYCKEGIHAGGIVISDFPVSDVIPIRMKKDQIDKWNKKKIEKWITQLDMHETEELGLIKFDLLVVENLDIISETCRLIKETQGIEIDPYSIPDEDEKAYKLLQHGLVAGVFQMETSGSAKELIQRVQPTNIEELSDINALNRPGPMQAGLHDTYVENKRNGYPPSEQPEEVSDVLKHSWWTLVYQEQVMKLATDLAGFTLQEADDVRRAMGKKKKEVLDKWRVRFIDGCVETGGLDRDYAEDLWTTLAGDGTGRAAGFADYCLAGHTKIRTSRGDIRIQDLVNNRWLVSVISDRDSDWVMKEVTQLHDLAPRECFTYELENGETVTCTPDHQFMTPEGKWVTIQEALELDIELKTYDV